MADKNKLVVEKTPEEKLDKILKTVTVIETQNEEIKAQNEEIVEKISNLCYSAIHGDD